MRPSRDIVVTLANRQTADSRFSHFEGTTEELIQLIRENLDMAYVGYRSGVYCVPVPPSRFMSGIVQLAEGECIYGKYEARRAGEEPRKWVVSNSREKLPAKSCEVILYHRTVLEEEAGYKAAADWEVISINASPTAEIPPIPPDALIANHFNLSGGTSTKMSASEFEALLRKSVLFWKDKAMCG